MTARWLTPAAVLACGLFALGCGGKGGSANRVSGTVTFADQPVKNGKIYFDPDAKENAGGQQGYADITDGKYDTAAGGKGVSGGKYTARIDGFGDKTDAYPGGKPLFQNFKESRDIPAAASTADFKVPKTAEAKLPKDPGPPP